MWYPLEVLISSDGDPLAYRLEDIIDLAQVLKLVFDHLDARDLLSGEPWQGNSLDPSKDGKVRN